MNFSKVLLETFFEYLLFKIDLRLGQLLLGLHKTSFEEKKTQS